MTVDFPAISADAVDSIAASSNEPAVEPRNRLLQDPDRVFEQNAWDHVEWDTQQYQEAQEIVQKQKTKVMEDERKVDYAVNANSYWDQFYGQHEHRFFKDRHWFPIEFPELFQRPAYLSPTDSFRIFEVGCGAGNTVFPVLRHHHHDPRTFVYACDFSSTAVELVRSNPEYTTQQCECFVHDLSDDSDQLYAHIPPESIDIVVLVFCLSALQPKDFGVAFSKLFKILRPGGVIVFRDYGRYDMTQLRFKPGSRIDENFYVRGDGTQVYFFSQEELEQLALNAGLIVEQNAVDRRLIVNRLRKLKMYRIWIQCKFRKPLKQ